MYFENLIHKGFLAISLSVILIFVYAVFACLQSFIERTIRRLTTPNIEYLDRSIKLVESDLKEFKRSLKRKR